MWAGSIIKPLPQPYAHSPSLSQIFLETRFPLISLACNRQCASYPQHAPQGCVNGHFTTSIIYWGLEVGEFVSLEHIVFWKALLYSRYLSHKKFCLMQETVILIIKYIVTKLYIQKNKKSIQKKGETETDLLNDFKFWKHAINFSL